MKHFAPEDLLRYLYNETSPQLTVAIEAELEQDWTLREKLAVLKTAQERLQRLVESPRTESVLNILHYAAKTETRISK